MQSASELQATRVWHYFVVVAAINPRGLNRFMQSTHPYILSMCCCELFYNAALVAGEALGSCLARLPRLVA